MDVFDLVAKIRLDSSEYEQGVGKAKGTFSTLASGVSKGLATVVKVGAAAVSAGAAGVAALTKMGVAGYAQYEQLASGMGKIFDGMDTKRIAADAANAYKDLGMSASEYLAIVNDVGASFAATMGNEAGYDAAKKGLTAISDYASGTGKNFGELQQKLAMITRSTSSYQSIADQFSGILPATSAGFLEQAQAAGVLEKKYKTLTEVPIEEYQRAVTDMLALGVDALNLTGNTAAEASSTLSGSLTMMKKAWENLVVGMSDPNADIGLLISNMVDSATAAGKQLMPTIERTLSGIGEVIVNLAPVVSEALPPLIETILPSLLTTGASLVTALANGAIEAAPAVLQAVLDAIEIILVDGFGVSAETASGFVNGLETAIQTIGDTISFAVENINTITGVLIAMGVAIGVVSTAIGLYNAVQAVKTAMDAANTTTLWGLVSAKLADAAATMAALAPYIAIVAAIAAVIAIIVLCVKHWDEITAAIGVAWEFIKQKTSEAVSAISAWFNGFISTVVGAWDSIITAISNAISSIYERISAFVGRMVEVGTSLITSLSEGIQNKFAELFTSVGGWVTDNIINPIANMGSSLYNAGVNLLNEFWDGLKSAWESVKSWWDGLSFSKKKAEVEVSNNGDKFATSMNYVPYDEFPAILHRGEAVLTAAEARVWRNGGYGTPAMAGGVTINQYIQSVPQTPVDLASTTEAYFEQARWML